MNQRTKKALVKKPDRRIFVLHRCDALEARLTAAQTTGTHLHRARLFFREKEYPKEWISPQANLAAAEKLINACGYHRRDEELAEAKKAILGASGKKGLPVPA